jgi:cytidine deaminase
MKKETHISYEYFNNKGELNDIEKNYLQKRKKRARMLMLPILIFWLAVLCFWKTERSIPEQSGECGVSFGTLRGKDCFFWIGANFPSEKIKKIFIVGGPKEFSEKNPPIPPCGSCRQSIIEYETKQNENIELYFSNLNDEVVKVHSIKDLLPFYFDGTFL